MKERTKFDDYMDISQLSDRAKKFMTKTCAECKYREDKEPEKSRYDRLAKLKIAKVFDNRLIPPYREIDEGDYMENRFNKLIEILQEKENANR